MVLSQISSFIPEVFLMERFSLAYENTLCSWTCLICDYFASPRIWGRDYAIMALNHFGDLAIWNALIKMNSVSLFWLSSARFIGFKTFSSCQVFFEAFKYLDSIFMDIPNMGNRSLNIRSINSISLRIAFSNSFFKNSNHVPWLCIKSFCLK